MIPCSLRWQIKEYFVFRGVWWHLLGDSDRIQAEWPGETLSPRSSRVPHKPFRSQRHRNLGMRWGKCQSTLTLANAQHYEMATPLAGLRDRPQETRKPNPTLERGPEIHHQHTIYNRLRHCPNKWMQIHHTYHYNTAWENRKKTLLALEGGGLSPLRILLFLLLL